MSPFATMFKVITQNSHEQDLAIRVITSKPEEWDNFDMEDVVLKRK